MIRSEKKRLAAGRKQRSLKQTQPPLSAEKVSRGEDGEAPKRGRIDISFFFLVIVLQTIGLMPPVQRGSRC